MAADNMAAVPLKSDSKLSFAKVRLRYYPRSSGVVNVSIFLKSLV
jgi:hypothetical protein